MTLVKTDRTGKRQYRALLLYITVAVIATAIDVITSLILSRHRLNPNLAAVVALLPLPGNLGLIFLILRSVRRLDEFKQRIHFEAVVFAFLATGVAVFIYSFFRKAQLVGPLSAVLVWLFMIASYGLGYGLARRQYK